MYADGALCRQDLSTLDLASIEQGQKQPLKESLSYGSFRARQAAGQVPREAGGEEAAGRAEQAETAGEQPAAARSARKVCPRGRQRSRCMDCGGGSICAHWRGEEHLQGLRGHGHLPA